MQTAIIILSILSLLQFILNCTFVKLYLQVLKEKKTYQENIENIMPGDKVYFEYNLTWSTDDHSFTSYCEADVMETSDKKVKVKVYNVRCNNISNDMNKTPNYKQIVIDFLDSHWIDKDKVELLLGKDYMREKKINKVLGI